MSEEFLEAARDGDLEKLKQLDLEGVDINYQNRNGYCALAYTVESGYDDCVAFLLELPGIDTSLEVQESLDSIGGIPLHIAAYRGYVDIIRLLVGECPRDMYAIEYCGYTPLHETVLNLQLRAFKLLLRLGDDYNIKTGSDNALTSIPEGIDTFQLILNQYRVFRGGKDILSEMFRLLIRRMLRAQETIVWNDDEEAEFRELNSIYEYEIARYEKDKTFLPSKETFSDTDSEEDADYTYHDYESIHLNKKKAPLSQSGTQYVLHARGSHFYKGKGSCASRERTKQLSDAGLLDLFGMYSQDTHKRCGIDLALPKETGKRKRGTIIEKHAGREKKLEHAAKKTKKALRKLNQTGEVAPVLQRGTKTSRKIFSSRLIELIQRYVNSYHSLTTDIESAQKQDVNSRKNERTKLKHKILKMLKANRACKLNCVTAHI